MYLSWRLNRQMNQPTIKRKLITLNNSSFVVSLPKDWIHANNFLKGEEILLETKGNNILIKGKVDKEIISEIDLSSMKYDPIWRHLICAYRKGSSVVNVKYGTTENLQSIMKFIPDLMGWAIVKMDNENLVIKDISPVEDIDFGDTFKKVFLLIIDMSEDVYRGISTRNKKALENITYSDYNINKFSNICLRILNLKGITSNTNSFYNIISTLEEIGDEYRKLAVFFPPANINNELLDIFRKVNDLLKLYYEIFYGFDSEKLKEFYEKADILLADFNKFRGKTNGETNAYVTLFTILHMIKSLNEENLVIKI